MSEPEKCHNCGCKTLITEIKDRIDVGVGVGIPCEYEYICSACGTPVAYFAYGHTEVYNDRDN